MNSLIQDVRLADRVLLKHRLVTLVATLSLALAIAGNTTVFSVDWRQRSRSFDELAAVRPGRFNLTGGDEPEPVRGVEVTANMFHLLRVEAAVGRTFRPEEEQPGRNEVAMVSYQFWETRFGSDPSLIGQTIELDGTPYRVVGVMPADFELFGFVPQVVVPAGHHPCRHRHLRRDRVLGVPADPRDRSAVAAASRSRPTIQG